MHIVESIGYLACDGLEYTLVLHSAVDIDEVQKIAMLK
jgi:hypothetical protein